MCAGFAASGVAHQLVNQTQTTVSYLEVGDRTPGDEGTYPRDDSYGNLQLMRNLLMSLDP
jgi:uncharacterized cupin superfamily protein